MTVPNHDPLRNGTLNGVLKDVGAAMGPDDADPCSASQSATPDWSRICSMPSRNCYSSPSQAARAPRHAPPCRFRARNDSRRRCFERRPRRRRAWLSNGSGLLLAKKSLDPLGDNRRTALVGVRCLLRHNEATGRDAGLVISCTLHSRTDVIAGPRGIAATSRGRGGHLVVSSREASNGPKLVRRMPAFGKALCGSRRPSVPATARMVYEIGSGDPA